MFRENWRKEVKRGRAAWVKQLIKAMRCGLMSHCLRKPWAKAEAETKRGHVAFVGPNLTSQAEREKHPDFTRISLFTYCASWFSCMCFSGQLIIQKDSLEYLYISNIMNSWGLSNVHYGGDKHLLLPCLPHPVYFQQLNSPNGRPDGEEWLANESDPINVPVSHWLGG